MPTESHQPPMSSCSPAQSAAALRKASGPVWEMSHEENGPFRELWRSEDRGRNRPQKHGHLLKCKPLGWIGRCFRGRCFKDVTRTDARWRSTHRIIVIFSDHLRAGPANAFPLDVSHFPWYRFWPFLLSCVLSSQSSGPETQTKTMPSDTPAHQESRPEFLDTCSGEIKCTRILLLCMTMRREARIGRVIT